MEVDGHNDRLIVVDSTNNRAAWQNLDPAVAKYIREHLVLEVAE